MTPKAQQQIKKNKFNFIKIKKFCILMDNIKKVKRQPTEWKKIFANHNSDEGLIFRKQRTTTQQQKDRQSN